MLKSKIALLAGVLFGACLSSHGAVVSTFTGGDIGQGINLSGNVIIALNVDAGGYGSGASISIGGINFVDAYNNGVLPSGVSSVGYNQHSEIWNQNASYGSTTNDTNLALMMHNIAYNSVWVDFNNLVPGQQYSLQVLAADPQQFGNTIDYNLVSGTHSAGTVVDSSTGNLWNLQGSSPLNTGVVVTLTGAADPSGHLSFTAPSTNADLTALILTQVPEPNAWASLLGGCGVLLGLRRRRYQG
jgi:hypothetical protein